MYADVVEVRQPGMADAVYNGPADVQYDTLAIRRLARTGSPVPTNAAAVYLPRTDGVDNLFASDRLGQAVVRMRPAGGNGPDRTGRVAAISPMDGSLIVDWGE